MTIGPGPVESPDAYEAANGVEAAPPGATPDNWVSRDPSAENGAVAESNADERQAEFASQLEPPGGVPGFTFDMPDAYTPQPVLPRAFTPNEGA